MMNNALVVDPSLQSSNEMLQEYVESGDKIIERSTESLQEMDGSITEAIINITESAAESRQVNSNSVTSDKCSEEGQKSPEECSNLQETAGEWTDVLGSGQLLRKVLKPSTNTYRPRKHEKVVVYLEIQLADSGVIVQNRERQEFYLGHFTVVEGLDMCIQLMNVGERDLVKVPSRLAYGEKGRLPDIPANADIVCDVELIESDKSSVLEAPLSCRLPLAIDAKERGNYFYGHGEHNQAISAYHLAIQLIDDVSTNDDETSQELKQEVYIEKSKLYNNLAAAQLKVGAWDAVLDSVRQCLILNPRNSKALFRKAKALAAKVRYEESLSAFELARELDPSSQLINAEIKKTSDLIKQQSLNDKELYRKMFSNSQSRIKQSSLWSKVATADSTSIILASTAVAVAVMGFIGFHLYNKGSLKL